MKVEENVLFKINMFKKWNEEEKRKRDKEVRGGGLKNKRKL
ncbi:MAG: hypothetical protein FYV88_4380 [Bacteroidetes bacterium]|nr:hypothetical protein [Bacteroidota bacterium]